jgi:hypothetical protein
MSKYVYQIQGALEDKQKFVGFRVIVCDANHMELVDVPVEILDTETMKYLQFRLSITAEGLSIQNLPIGIQNRIRAPLGRWLDYWVCKNFYGYTSDGKSINP